MSYFTLLIRDEMGWHDECGFKTKKEATDERQFQNDMGIRKCDMTIIETDGTAAQLIAALERMNTK